MTTAKQKRRVLVKRYRRAVRAYERACVQAVREPGMPGYVRLPQGAFALACAVDDAAAAVYGHDNNMEPWLAAIALSHMDDEAAP